MTEFPTYEQIVKDVAEKALDQFLIEGKTLREWIKVIAKQEHCNDAVSRHVVKEQMIKYGFHAPDMTVTEFVEDLPPVNPAPKMEE